MHFGDRPAACGLEVAKHMVADLGKMIDPDASEMIKKGYVDDNIAGGDEAAVDRLVGKETLQEGKPSYDGTIPQILAHGSFNVKVMVRDGETRSEVIKLLGGGVLGLP